jgi:hypothetical protein
VLPLVGVAMVGAFDICSASTATPALIAAITRS